MTHLTLDCQSCGECCRGEDGWVPVDGTDEPHVENCPDLAKNLVLLRHGALVRRSLRMIEGRCFALSRSNTDGRVACRIYPDRPSACRALEAGSPACLEAIDRRRSRLAGC